MSEITHLCPPEGEYVMPCCGKTPFEVPSTDRMTLDPEQVTCGHRDGRAAMAETFILVTGSRTYAKPDVIRTAFARVHERYRGHTITLVDGQCDPWHPDTSRPIPWARARRLSWEVQDRLLGADWHAAIIAAQLGWRIKLMPADWFPGGRFDRSAGFRRNADMVKLVAEAIADGAAGECHALADECVKRLCREPRPHGSHGTLHCASLAEEAGIETRYHGFDPHGQALALFEGSTDG